MEFVVILAVVLVCVLLIKINQLLGILKKIEFKLYSIEIDIQSLKSKGIAEKEVDKSIETSTSEVVEKSVVVKDDFLISPIISEPELAQNEPTEEEVLAKVNAFKKQIGIAQNEEITEQDLEADITNKPEVVQEETKVFEQRKVDFEKFIGENIVNKIGIAVLVLGISFFIKYAIDNNWINEVGRTAIGGLCGLIMLFFAKKIQHNYRSFSSVLIGGALAVFYTTVTFAFHQYQLINHAVAFLLMCIISSFAIFLSLKFDRIELAVIAILGGFLTPFLVSNDSENFVMLFLYMQLLNVTSIILALRKQWFLLQFICLFSTLIILFGWLIGNYHQSNYECIWSIVFTCVYFITFMFSELKRIDVKANQEVYVDYKWLISINFLFFGLAMYAISNSSLTQYDAYIPLLFAAFSLIGKFYISKNEKNNALQSLFTGIMISYITLFVPIYFHAKNISIFWFVEAGLLVWLSQKYAQKQLKLFASIVYGLAVFFLFINWASQYSHNQPNDSLGIVKLKEALVNTVVGTLSFYFLTLQLKTKKEEEFILKLSNEIAIKIGTSFYLVILYTGSICEINYQVEHYVDSNTITLLYCSLFTYLFVIVSKQKIMMLFNTYATQFLYFLLLLFTLIYCLQSAAVYQIIVDVILQHRFSFLHLVVYVLLTVLLIYFIFKLTQHNTWSVEYSKNMDVIYVISSISFLLVITIFFFHAYLMLGLKQQSELAIIKNNIYRAGFSVLWSIVSFVSMWYGMKKNKKILRILSLILFGITLLKLFIFDLIHVAPAGKIIAFILLGVLLLIISFMYQKLKSILFSEDERN